MPMPAVSLAAVPGKRARALEMAAEIERRGFSGHLLPEPRGRARLVHVARARHVDDPVRHGDRADLLPPPDVDGPDRVVHPRGERRSLRPRPRREPRPGARAAAPRCRQARCPTCATTSRRCARPTVSASCRRSCWRRCETRWSSLAAEVADGAVWANASRSRMAESLASRPRRPPGAGFFVGNMIPTVIDDDRAAAAAINRTHAHRLRRAAELPQLLEGGGLRRGDGRHRGGDRGGRSRSACRSS